MAGSAYRREALPPVSPRAARGSVRGMTVVGLVAVGLATLALIVLHVVGRSLSAVQRTISEYALIGPVPRVLFGVFALSLALSGLAVLVAEIDRPVAVVALAVFALGTTAVAFFPTDEIDPEAGDVELSRDGRIHTVGAFAAFLGLVVAGFAVGPIGTGPLTALVPFVPLLGVLAFVVTLAARRPLGRLTGVAAVHGIGERILVVGQLGWLAIMLVAHA